jgi:hypothetical protein
MFTVLAVICGLIGLAVTGAAVYTAWRIYAPGGTGETGETGEHPAESSVKHHTGALLRWTALDYAVLALFGSGMLLLLADLLAVSRDRLAFPDYHYGYLLAGFTLTLLGMLFTLARLVLVLRLSRERRPPAPHEDGQPVEAD